VLQQSLWKRYQIVLAVSGGRTPPSPKGSEYISLRAHGESLVNKLTLIERRGSGCGTKNGAVLLLCLCVQGDLAEFPSISEADRQTQPRNLALAADATRCTLDRNTNTSRPVRAVVEAFQAHTTVSGGESTVRQKD
jgi:hypothetical protein